MTPQSPHYKPWCVLSTDYPSNIWKYKGIALWDNGNRKGGCPIIYARYTETVRLLFADENLNLKAQIKIFSQQDSRFH